MAQGTFWPDGTRGVLMRARGWVFLAAAAGGILSAQTPAVADDLMVQAKGTETVEHDDNPLVISRGVKSVTGSITAPEAIVNDDTPTTHVDLDTLLDFNEYDLADFSSTDVHSNFHSSYKGEVDSLGLNGGFDYDTTRTSELTSTGVNIAGIRHTGFNLSPQAGFGISPSDRIFLNASYLHSSYGSTTLYTDYAFYSLSPSLQHEFSQQDTGFVSLEANRFETASGPQAGVDSIGPMVGWVRTLSERFTLSGSMGFQRSINQVPTSSVGNSSGTWSFIYDFDLAYRDQQDVLHLTSSRNSSPESNGAEALVTSFGVTEVHSVTTRFAAELSLQYQFESYTTRVTGVASDYMNVSPSLRYDLTDDLAVVPSYRYRRQDTLGVAGAQTSNTVMVNLVYTPTQWLLGL